MENIKEGKAQQALIRSSLIPAKPRAASSTTSSRPAYDASPPKKSRVNFSVPRAQPDREQRKHREPAPGPRESARPRAAQGGQGTR